MAKAVGSLIVVALTMFGTGFQSAHGRSQETTPLPEQWNKLAMITGFHSVANTKTGLAIRVLEADGSASVAENPIALFIVATNGGTRDLKEHIWRLPEGVERVKKVVKSNCGVDIQAEVDSGEDSAAGRKLTVIKACFVKANGELDSRLRTDETN